MGFNCTHSINDQVSPKLPIISLDKADLPAVIILYPHLTGLYLGLSSRLYEVDTDSAALKIASMTTSEASSWPTSVTTTLPGPILRAIFGYVAELPTGIAFHLVRSSR